MFKINYIVSLATILVLVAIFFIFNAEQSRYLLVGTNRADNNGLFVFDSKDKNLNYCNEKNCNPLSIIKPMFNNQMPTNSCGFNNIIPQSVYNFGQSNPQPNNQLQTGITCCNQPQQNSTGFYGQPQAMFTQTTNPVPDGMKQMIDENGKPLPIIQTRLPQGCNDYGCANPLPQTQTNQPMNQSLCDEYKRQSDEYKKKYDEYKEKLKNVLTDKISSLEKNTQATNDSGSTSAEDQAQQGDNQGEEAPENSDENTNNTDGQSGDDASGDNAGADDQNSDQQEQSSDTGSQDDGSSGGDDSGNQDG